MKRGEIIKKIILTIGIFSIIIAYLVIIEKITTVIIEKYEFNSFVSSYNDTSTEFNNAINSFETAHAEEDVNIAIEKMENKAMPLLKSALTISEKTNFKSESLIELKKQRSNVILKSIEGHQLLIDTYKNPESTVEDLDAANKVIDESYLMSEKMKKDLMKRAYTLDINVKLSNKQPN